MRLRPGLIGVAALVAGTLLRALAIKQDLWLDEIWAIQAAATLHSAQDVFFQLPLDNNHILITLWMYALGDQADAIAYRAPSLLAGIATIAIAWRIGLARDARHAWVYATVFAASFALTVYAVEARGYALAVACALGVYALFEGRTWPSARRVAGIGLLGALGFMAHLIFAHFYAAFGVWSLLRARRTQPNAMRAAASLLQLHALPALSALTLYLTVLKNLRSVGGEQAPYANVIGDALSWAIGLPAELGVIGLATCVLAVLAWDVRARYRAGDDSWLFFPLIVLAPMALTLPLHPRLVVPRYFMLSIAFFLLPCCASIAAVLARSRPAALLLLALVVAGNLRQTLPFLEYGRGHYADAVRFVGAQTAGADVVIGSDHDVRNARVLAYYGRLLWPEHRINYVAHADRAPLAPRWLVLHSFAQPPAPRATLVVRSGAAYRLRKTFPYWGPSGFHWFVYENASERAVANP